MRDKVKEKEKDAKINGWDLVSTMRKKARREDS